MPPYDYFGLDARPREGFVIPPVGTTVTTLAPYALACGRTRDRWGREFDGVLPAGTTGKVTAIRAPGVECRGYVGLVVGWDVENVAYPYAAGVVMQWDVIDDPTVFSFSSEVS